MEYNEETWNCRFLNLLIDYEIQDLEIQYKQFYDDDDDDDDFENLDPWISNSEMSVQDARNLISKFTTSTKYDYNEEDIDKLFSSELDNEVSQSARTSISTSNRSSLSSTLPLPDDESKDSALNFKTSEDDHIETSNPSTSLSTAPDGEREDPDSNSKSIEDDQIEEPNPLSSSILPDNSDMKPEDVENEISNLPSSLSILLDGEIGDPDYSFKINEEVQVEYDWKEDIKDFQLMWNIADLF